MDIENLKYPIGKYEFPQDFNSSYITKWIDDLEALPELVYRISKDLTAEQLEKPYRPEGWTARQVVNHLADSHINAYCRFHLALTEENPTIRAYDEVAWAKLPDGFSGDIEHSIAILRGVHARLVMLLKTLELEDYNRTYFHPEAQQQFTVAYLLGNYAWHGKHHLAHIQLTL